MSPIIDTFCDYYQELTPASLLNLDKVYSQDVVFVDPVHSIDGLGAVSDYFEAMVVNISHCRFNIDNVIENENQAFITWEMDFAHPKLNRGRAVVVPGSSHLKFTDHIHYHRDYYDLGHMVYEQIPILKNVIATIKRRMSA